MKELIELLRYTEVNGDRDPQNYVTNLCGSCYLCEQAADALERLEKQVQKWIPVSERLPDKDGKYLTYYHNHFGDITRVLDFAKDARKVNKYDFHQSWKKVWYEYDSEYGYFTIDDVTHWMPLPEPPKGETE